MSALLALWMTAAAPLAAAAPATDDVAALERVWSGVRDSSEQVVTGPGQGAISWEETGERRIRTVVAPVPAPFLGAHVLYLEEFVEDDPQAPRRQLLVSLEPVPERAHAVRARLYAFTSPPRWRHLDHRAALAAALTRADVVAAPGCELLLTRAADQFRGGTTGRQCEANTAGEARYLDYQLLISEDLYWYRRRLLRRSDDALEEEVIGFNHFQPNEARLYACRVAWSASGRARDLEPLLTLDLYEAGGRARFTTPDGRALELTLHGRDWPYAVDRDALLLLLREPDHEYPLATAWAQRDSQQIALALEWLDVRCGSLAADSDEVSQ